MITSSTDLNKNVFDILDIVVECIDNEQSIKQLERFSLLLDKLTNINK